jgi:curved DNA-binding protein
VYELPLTIDELINGTQKTITISQGGIATAIDFKIPKGLTQGKKIRLTGKGETSTNGGPTGDLYIKSSPITEEEISIDGNDISLTQEVPLSQALLGGKLQITTPSGKIINLTLPLGTNHKSKMRIPNHGIPQMKGNGCGDLFVVINIIMPKELNKKQADLIKKLEQTGL